MALAATTFGQATVGKYSASGLNPKRQKLLMLLSYAAILKDIIGGGTDYCTTAAAFASLFSDSRKYAQGLSPDGIRAARIWTAVNNSGTITSLPSLTNSLAIVNRFQQLSDLEIERMQLVLDYYLAGNS